MLEENYKDVIHLNNLTEMEEDYDPIRRYISKEEWKKLNASKEDLKLHPQVMELHELLRQQLTEKEYKQIKIIRIIRIKN